MRDEQHEQEAIDCVNYLAERLAQTLNRYDTSRFAPKTGVSALTLLIFTAFSYSAAGDQEAYDAACDKLAKTLKECWRVPGRPTLQ